MAELSVLIAELHRMNNDQITRLMRLRLRQAASPLLPQVRSAILNLPSKGTVPYRQPPGLRLRIADCVEAWTWVNGPQVQVGIAVNGARMPDGQKALPLYMEGAKAPWRHPTFGDTGNWVEQTPHPYFYSAVSWYGPASRRTLENVASEITRRLDG
jgi:hypothetical protein